MEGTSYSYFYCVLCDIKLSLICELYKLAVSIKAMDVCSDVFKLSNK